MFECVWQALVLLLLAGLGAGRGAGQMGGADTMGSLAQLMTDFPSLEAVPDARTFGEFQVRQNIHLHLQSVLNKRNHYCSRLCRRCGCRVGAGM